ncbi:MAG: radical SAM protein [Candidatus Bathyarchaeia archaeon]
MKLNSDCSPPLGLAYLASYLRANVQAVEVKIFDGATGLDVWGCLTEFMPDVVGITATTPQVPDAYALAERVKRCWFKTTVVLGGPHVSAMPEEAQAYCDFVVVGEGEKTFADLVLSLQSGFNHFSRIIQGLPLENLDSIPQAAFDLLDMPFYLQRRFIEQVLPPPILGLVTSRGCPYRCVFCYNSGRSSRVRYFSAKRVVSDLLFLHEKYGVSNFFFQDDEFLINVERLKELAAMFKRFGIDKWIKWGCQARVTSLNIAVLDLAESIGCQLIVPGFESYNARILKYLKNDSVQKADIDRAVKLFKNRKTVLGGNFVYGSPTETLAEMKENFKFYLDTSEITFMNANVLTPYPGTQVWKELELKNVDYDKMLPTNEGDVAVNYSAVSDLEFKRFILEVKRVSWLVQSIRFHPCLGAFFGLWRAKTWWWMWLKHPVIMFRLLMFCKLIHQSSSLDAKTMEGKA